MKVVDRLRQSFNATSTAAITLGGAVVGFRTIAEAIAHGDLAIGDEVPMCVESGASWELSLYRVDNPTQLTRLEVMASWTGGAAVTFPSGLKQIFCAPPAEYLNGVQAAALPVLTSIADATRLLALNPSNGAFLVTAAVLKAYIGGTAPPADSTLPSAPTNLASTNVGQTGYTITFTPGTDNVGVAHHEWSLDGSTWTPVSGGAAGNTFSLTGRTAGSTDTIRLRTVDTSGNVSNVATLSVTLQSAGGGNAAPALSGSISKTNITSSGYTFSWPAPTDANGNGDRIETSIDGGTNWTASAFAAGSRIVTDRTAGIDQLRVRAIDAAGAISNVLSDSVTMVGAGYAGPDYQLVAKNGSGGMLEYAKLPPAGARPLAVPTALYIKTAGGEFPDSGNVKYGWFPAGTTPTFAQLEHSTQHMGWAGYNGLYDHLGNTPYVYANQPAGNYELWFGISGGPGDGFLKKYTENGSPYLLAVS